MYNTKLDAIGIINTQESEATYHTLGLIRNIAKARIPCASDGQNEYKMLYEKVLQENEQMKKERSPTLKKKDVMK